ncbi:MAG TPA: head GIN domain-containing protein [Sediminibacterium sp.]|nr:head GIN domain-containing protein [Sediminibacterium sp.]
MKKNLFNLLLLLLLVQLAACSKSIRGSGNIVQQTLAVDSFHAIETNGSFDVQVEQLNTPSGLLLIEADDNIIPVIEARVVNHVLKVQYNTITNIKTRKTPKVWVNTGRLSRLFINGSGSIVTSGNRVGPELELRVNGSGDIVTSYQAQTLNASISGSGTIHLNGSAAVTDFYISGSGKINGADFITGKARLVLSGSGNMYCGVERELDASVSGSGNIYYKGNPAIVRTQISGSGQIIRQ